MAEHDHHHDHGHEPHHGAAGHHHVPASFGKAFAIGIALNLAYVVGEAFYGIIAHSLALLADAGHNLGDVLGLAGAWLASVLGQRRPSGRYTYGLRRSSILAALGNAIVLLVVTGGIAWEGIRRLINPEPVGGLIIMVVAAVGILVNGLTALLFMSGRKGDLNIKGAFLHMASDALVALGVVLAGAVMMWRGWPWLDPAISLVISVVIVAGTWSLLRDSVNLALDAVPPGIKPGDVTAFLKQQRGVAAIHDLHIWPMSTTETALTCHCLMPGGHPGDEFLVHLAHDLQERFNIGHATIQVEVNEQIACKLEPDHVV
ncbi:cation diffusion facilitator family transporter [Rhodopila sp.]|uniref:cation diffusion facilitator family transporter n=1 Tax=Rhodopila sp. TaxID=2480087 RepID=UPI003D0E81FA